MTAGCVLYDPPAALASFYSKIDFIWHPSRRLNPANLAAAVIRASIFTAFIGGLQRRES